MKPSSSVFSFIVSLLAAVPAGAFTIAMSNVPGSGSYDKAKMLSTTEWEAIGLTTDASSQDFTSLVGVFAGGTTGGTLEGGIYSDNGFNAPGLELASFNDVPVNPFLMPQVTITTHSAFQLQASTKYWLVLHDSTPFAWMADNTTSGTTPGVAPGYMYDGFDTSSNAGGTWSTDDINYTVQISTTPVAVVPEPSTLVLAAAGVVGIAIVARRRRSGR
jgi:hypothetical protein